MHHPFKFSEKTQMFDDEEVNEPRMQNSSETNSLSRIKDCLCICNYTVITALKVCVRAEAQFECLCDSLFIDEKRHHKEHLEEASYSTDLDGVHPLDGFHQEGDDCEEN